MEQRQEERKDLADLVEKDFEGFPDVAADIINALLYRGGPNVLEQNLVPAPTESLYQGAQRIRNQFQDLERYEMQDGDVKAIYQFANQSGPDPYMLFRKAGYTGGAYREQYDKKVPYHCPVIELILYWGQERWRGSRSMKRMFRQKKLPPDAWKYIDNIKLHVWEMRHLEPEVRERFQSDMRIVVDFLAEGNAYRSDRPVRHKEALIKMIRVLSGETEVDDTAQMLKDCGIKEEDEIKVCELFDQYERRGRQAGILDGRQEGMIQGAIVICKKLKITFEVTAEQIKEQFQLSDEATQRNMELYW